MTFEYKPHGFYAQKVQSDQCKASVTSGDRGARAHQCSRKPKRDGWCNRHHPDAERARRTEADAKYRAQREAMSHRIAVETAENELVAKAIEALPAIRSNAERGGSLLALRDAIHALTELSARKKEPE